MAHHSGFSTADVSRLTGLSPRQVDHWVRLGILSSSLAAAQGSGSQRRWSYRDILTARVAARLRKAGFDLTAIGRALTFIRHRLSDVATQIVIADDGQVLATTHAGEIISLTQQGQLVLSFALQPMAESLQAEIAALPHSPPEYKSDSSRALLSGQLALDLAS